VAAEVFEAWRHEAAWFLYGLVAGWILGAVAS
jgi:hypothetical protein